MTRPGVERKDAPHLTAQQAQALLEAIRGDRLESLFRVTLATGLRRGEALGLHWSDLDLDAALLGVRCPSRSAPACAASPSTPSALRRQLPAGRRNPHQGRPGHLGHSSYAITADIYSHAGPAQQREAAERLDQPLRR